MRELIREGKILISGVEKCSLIPYEGKADAPGVWTIGWGHVIRANEKSLMKGITQAQADAIFARDLEEHTKNIQHDVGANVPLNDHVYAAFASFAFNLGPDIFKSANSVVNFMRTAEPAKGILNMYKFSNSGKPLVYKDGLFYRRLVEMVLALDKQLVKKPDDCIEANALIVRLAKHGSVTEMRSFFHTKHIKAKCRICKPK